MSTEFYARGGVVSGRACPYDMAKYLGARVGLGDTRTGFSWDIHPEHGMQLVAEAGGATDAYGREFTVREFVAMLRSCEQQVWLKCEIYAHAERTRHG